MQVIAYAQTRDVHKGVGAVHLSLDRHVGGNMGHHEAVAVFERNIRDCLDPEAVRLERKHDTANRRDVPQPVHGRLPIGSGCVGRKASGVNPPARRSRPRSVSPGSTLYTPAWLNSPSSRT